MFRLVSSGTPHLGLTGWGLLDTFSVDVVLDFAYGMLVENADTKDREALDRSLAELDAPSAEKMVDVGLHDGTTVRISESRLAELQANATNIRHMKVR